ncbi:capsular polysaccharide biosynthesis protein [Paracoccus sediminis]|uniref:Capsular polysaccharide biosynthesis protein n=1 Tax=Paracoccus sediminis TaxID=1214787 RepID=A0A238X385_9RHOB|nr:capsular polysaccharide biosynthesis protein [Paracoccus sediminis]TBN49257.1 capsular polysaccharide biosynthesis protein [Paracoccus sediminis]SNR53377.1 capsular polysaccharide export protein [Paracoccus sediminis]
MTNGSKAAGTGTRRLFAFNRGFWHGPRLRRILELAGWDLRFGLPGAGDDVAIWGASPTAWRGRAIAARAGARLIAVEDAFLRSILPGRARGRVASRGPIGLMIDPHGLHFDPGRPSLIERLIVQGATAGHEQRALDGIARLRALDLSKYNAHRPDLPAPEPGYVLVIDQTRGDASLMGAGRDRFLAMLDAARRENPGRSILLRSHPETIRGLRPGHLGPSDLRPGDSLCGTETSPWRLLDNAHAIYAVSSQLGYEAILAGHVPRLFGQPFYAGWGLSQDRDPLPSGRRGSATVDALFAASHLLAPVWYDPCRDCLTGFDGAVDQIEAEARAFRQDRDGHLAYGMRLWKRPFISRAFGDGTGVRFANRPSPSVTLAWAGKADATPQAIRVEDGFLRSRGLGADLTPPLSLVADDLGIHYDPTRESRLERLIADGPPPAGRARAVRLIEAILAARLSKYNLMGAAYRPAPTTRRRILVPGQVQDDASIRLGAGSERTNLDLLRRVRRDNPDAHLIFKPHPDVEAGLRAGAISADLADEIALATDPAALLDHVDEVWTITSTLGFEALMRGIPVTTLGAPFYAGWGLTRDLGPVPVRRVARPDLTTLVHACLIAYPRYRDPITGLPCPVEVAVDRLRNGITLRPPALRLLARMQGLLAGRAWLWRR